MTRNQFVIIWNIIQDFDYKTNNLGFFQNEKKTKFYSWIILIGSFLIWLYINQTGMYAFMETFVQNFSYMYGYIGTGFSVFKFSGIVAILGQRFKHLNKITNDSSSSESTCASSSKVDQKVLKIIIIIIIIYEIKKQNFLFFNYFFFFNTIKSY